MLLDLKLNKTCRLKAPPAAVWDALVNPEKIKAYLFGTQTICDWKVGSPIVFSGEWEGKAYRDKGVILDIQPARRLSYSYYSSMSPLPDLPENYSVLTFSLQEDQNETALSLEQTGFPDEAALKHSEENWGYVLEGIRSIVEARQ